ncbi:MAG: hypothetical protein HYZ43_11275 [Flavobacteriia bacterium]|nr:hypothetical protein [Flavobacteriia bacterium]
MRTLRTEGIGNKIFLIALLCAALGLFLFIRPRLFAPEPKPSLIDRLPESEILGRFYLLDVARESSPMLFYHKIPFRDLASADFLLSQAKNFGLDVQKQSYFFADRSGEWGTFLSVIDSSRIQNGLIKLEQFVPVTDTTILQRKVRFLPKQNLYIFYDKTYLMVYHGTKIKARLSRCINAKHGEMGDSWKKFQSLKTFRDDKLVVFSNDKKLKKYGVEYSLFAHDSDSLSFKLKTYIKTSKNHKLKMKVSGSAFESTPTTTRMLDLHLDISEFRKDKKHPLYLWIAEMGRKVSFPTDAFFAAWDGDLCFQQGGTQMVEEEVVETGYNEEFEMTEIRTTRLVPIPGFAVMISVNDQSKNLVSGLFSKGIINKQGNKYRFLFSPPLTLNIKPTTISAYSSGRSPKVNTGSNCSGLWNYKGTPVAFQVDSLKQRGVYGSIQFPVNRLIRRSKFF